VGSTALNASTSSTLSAGVGQVLDIRRMHAYKNPHGFFNALYELSELKRICGSPPSDTTGIGEAFKRLSIGINPKVESRFQSLAALGEDLPIGQLFTPEFQALQYIPHGFGTSDYDLPNYMTVLAQGPEAFTRVIYEHMRKHPLEKLASLHTYLIKAGVTPDMPIKLVIEKMHKQAMDMLSDFLRSGAIQDPRQFTASLTKHISQSGYRIPIEEIERVLDTAGIIDKPDAEGNNPLGDLRRKITLDVATIYEGRAQGKQIEFHDFPEHLRLFSTENFYVHHHMDSLIEWFKEQGVPPEELTEENLLFGHYVIGVKRGGVAEQVMLRHITSRRPEVPEGWQPQEAEATVQEKQYTGTVQPSTAVTQETALS